MGNPLLNVLLLCLDNGSGFNAVCLVCEVHRFQRRDSYLPYSDLCSSWRINVHDKDIDLFWLGSLGGNNSNLFLKKA